MKIPIDTMLALRFATSSMDRLTNAFFAYRLVANPSWLYSTIIK